MPAAAAVQAPPEAALLVWRLRRRLQVRPRPQHRLRLEEPEAAGAAHAAAAESAIITKGFEEIVRFNR